MPLRLAPLLPEAISLAIALAISPAITLAISLAITLAISPAIAGSAERQTKSRFGGSFSSLQKATFGTLGCWPRARSVLHCHGILALRQGPSTSCARLQKAHLALWAAGRGLAAMVFWPCDRVLGPEL